MKPLTESDVQRASRMAANMSDVQHKTLLRLSRAANGETCEFNSVVFANLRSRGLIKHVPSGGFSLTPEAEILLRFLAGEAVDL